MAITKTERGSKQSNVKYHRHKRRRPKYLMCDLYRYRQDKRAAHLCVVMREVKSRFIMRQASNICSHYLRFVVHTLEGVLTGDERRSDRRWSTGVGRMSTCWRRANERDSVSPLRIRSPPLPSRRFIYEWEDTLTYVINSAAACTRVDAVNVFGPSSHPFCDWNSYRTDNRARGWSPRAPRAHTNICCALIADVSQWTRNRTLN